MTFEELVKKFGKRCPHCKGGKISSYGDPLWQHCLDCGLRFPDTESLRPPKDGWLEQEGR